MKAKKFGVLAVGVLSMAALGGIVAYQNSTGKLSFFTKATVEHAASYTLTASDFSSGSGDLTKGGATWHYDNAIIDGSTVTLKSVFYTTVQSGSSKEDGKRGNGYTRIVFDNFVKNTDGVVLHLRDVNGGNTLTGQAVSEDINLVSITDDASKRRGLYFAQGTEQSFSFTSATFYYDCSEVSPEVNITSSDLSIGVGEEAANIYAEASDVFAGDTVTYSWSSSNTDILTVTGDTLTGSFTGVAAGHANAIITMTVNGVQYTDSIDVEVTAVAAEVINVNTGNGSYIDGNQVFTYFDTTSTGLSAETITGFGIYESSVSNISNTIQSNEIQNVAGNTFRIYSPMKNGAVGLSGQFGIKYDFKDSANNKIYRAQAYYDGGEIAKDIKLTAVAFSVEESDDIEITASKAWYLDGEATFAFESLDTNVFTVTNINNVATITGVAEGSATLRVTMTISGDDYVIDKVITVTAPGVQHLIPWYTDGTGNQANHRDGAGVWTWVKYSDLGYTWSEFSAIKNSISVSYSTTTVRVEVISDDNATLKYARVYLVLGAAVDGKLTMSLPNKDGVTYTGTITFVDSAATSFND